MYHAGIHLVSLCDESCMRSDSVVGEPVHVRITLRPERNPALIRNMIYGFGDVKECSRVTGVGRFKSTLRVNAIAGKSVT